MFASDHSIQFSRQRITDLHAQADRRRLARSIPVSPSRRAAALRQLATTVVLASAPVVVLVLETAAARHP
jgi:hypothetical protein